MEENEKTQREDGMRILIAEDNEKLLKSLLHVFQRSKFAADGVGNGRDALDYALSGERDSTPARTIT